jgi:hypothetical protein
MRHDTKNGPAERDGWGPWGRRAATGVLLVHITAVLAAALAAPPSSPLERSVANFFEPYKEVIDQGYAYRYYAPEPPPTPVVTATVRYVDGRPEETIRLPRRGLWPRLLYQRQLALAYHLRADYLDARQAAGDGSRSHYARSFARHIARERPGCETVSLYVQEHLIPNPARVAEDLASGRKVDLDDEEYFTVPERIGEFPCDAS